MIRINLISEGRRPVVARKAKARVNLGEQDPSLYILAGGVVVGLLIGLVWYWILNSTLNEVNSDIRKARAEVKELKPILKEVKAFKKKRRQLNTKIDLINDLTAKRRGPVHLMDRVSRALPDLVWLKSMNVRGKRVNLSGQALNTNAIAAFIENLSLVPEFKEPDTRNVRRAKRNTYTFQINFRFELPKPPASADEAQADQT